MGNRNPGIETENVFKDVYELRGKNRARMYYREVDGKIEILGKLVKSNQQKVINILKKMYIKKIFGQILLEQASSKVVIPQRCFQNRQIIP